MPTFEITGIGRESGRKRTRRYRAVDEARARALAEKDGTSVVAITALPPDPPSGAQLAYARDLGIVVPDDASKDDVSDLIDARLNWDKPAPNTYQEFARRHGVEFTKYIGKKALFARLFHRLCQPGRERDMAAWFVLRVYRELTGGKAEGKIDGPDEPLIQEIAEQLIEDEVVIRSMRRYEGRKLVWFGEWTSPDGTVREGGSNRTIAYKRAVALLREKAGEEVRNSPQTRRAHEAGVSVPRNVLPRKREGNA